MAKTPAKTPAPDTVSPAAPIRGMTDNVVEGEAGIAKPEGTNGQLRLKDLVDTVMQATGAKPKDVREIVLATLAQLGAALDRGDGLNLPEFGKGRVTRSNTEADGSTSLVLKIKRGIVPKKKDDKEALAAASE